MKKAFYKIISIILSLSMIFSVCNLIATAEDTAKTAGIDLTDKNFWRGALQILADEIDQFCQLVQEV